MVLLSSYSILNSIILSCCGLLWSVISKCTLGTHILRVQDGVLLNDHVSCCLTKKLKETLATMRRIGPQLIIGYMIDQSIIASSDSVTFQQSNIFTWEKGKLILSLNLAEMLEKRPKRKSIMKTIISIFGLESFSPLRSINDGRCRSIFSTGFRFYLNEDVYPWWQSSYRSPLACVSFIESTKTNPKIQLSTLDPLLETVLGVVPVLLLEY